MAAPPNQLFSAFAFIGFVMCSVPFYWHLEAWNTGTCLYMAWTGLACLNQFINSIVWNHNAINWAPVWCDISTRFMIGTTVAIPAASLCINRRLYNIASIKAVTISRKEKQHGIMIDLAIGLGIPILEMILQCIVQGHRFDILEDVGCFPATYNTPPAYALTLAWPVAIGAVSLVYCVLSIRQFWIRKQQFNDIVSSNRNLNQSRYLRLIALAGIELLGTIPLGSYSLYLNTTNNSIHPWISWADTHFDFSHVGQIPSVIWRADSQVEASVELSRWLIVLCAFIFFAFFGFAQEARRHYSLVYTHVSSRLGYSTVTTGSTNFTGSNSWKLPTMSSSGGGYNLPIFINSRKASSDTLSTSIFIDALPHDTDFKRGPRNDLPPPSFDLRKSLPSTPDSPVSEHEFTQPRPDSPALDPMALPPRALEIWTAPRHAPDAPIPARPGSTFTI
ncbi:putative B mating type protein [Heterobasidion irregulare TC 32-1]|uniref:Putative B mating type protein n=1 Tax=Heterobasidion irregulare (strain TC 32-1) TaxID=747525 RepID=W4K1U2_HETIT|nr:putative B mating type protein [Heterobasidion irregulare TC 32-1]ETW79704.1 putative B mating type protein [Heterobasidion irregulare TC 32-1]